MALLSGDRTKVKGEESNCVHKRLLLYLRRWFQCHCRAKRSRARAGSASSRSRRRSLLLRRSSRNREAGLALVWLISVASGGASGPADCSTLTAMDLTERRAYAGACSCAREKLMRRALVTRRMRCWSVRWTKSLIFLSSTSK